MEKQNLGIQIGTTEASFNSRILKNKKDRISDTEVVKEEMKTLVKIYIKSKKKNPGTGNMEHYEKNKPKNNRNKGGR